MVFNGVKFATICQADGKKQTGIQLTTQIKKKAACLSSVGVQERDHLIISHANSIEFFTDLFAVWLVGACAVCINPGLVTNEKKRIIELVKPRLELRGLTEERADSNPIDQLHLNSMLSVNDFVEYELPGGGAIDDPALILFTSGTTGKPKGVVHSFRSLYARVSLNLHQFVEGQLKTVLCPLPTYFGHGLIGICLTTLIGGRRLVLCDGSSVGTLAKFGELIDQEKVTFLSSVPSLWRLILRLSTPPKANSLKRVFVGSAPLNANLWRSIIEWSGGCEVANVYGITETANWIGSGSPVCDVPEDGFVGRVWDGHAAVLSESGQVELTGHGEVIVQTPSIMQGYFQRPSDTRSALVGGYFRTGDLGKIDEDGSIRILGRVKTQINRGGVKILPEELDALIEQSDLVRDVATFGISDEVAGELVGVALVLQRSPTNDHDRAMIISELREWIRDKIAPDKQADKFFIVDSLPTNRNGKLDRKKLRELCESGALGQARI